MKKTAFISLSLLMAGGYAMAQQNFVIKGQLPGIPAKATIKLIMLKDDKVIYDSAIAQNGIFQLAGDAGTEPVRGYLSMRYENVKGSTGPAKFDRQEILLENGTCTVKGKTLEDAVITGGRAQADLNVLNSRLSVIKKEMKVLTDSIVHYEYAKQEQDAKRLLPQLQEKRSQRSEVENNFIREFPDSYLSLMLVKDHAAVIEVPEFEPVFNALSERVRTTNEGKKLAARLAVAKRTSVGQPALDFTQNNTKGEPVSLGSLKGKYVLLDFWASWCGPCRAENPHVVAAYKKFHHKNFEVLAVSLDDKKEKWLDAIEKDGLTWLHVSDLKGWKNEVAEAYGIKAVPQNYLLDTKGMIIAKNLSGEALEAKLKEVLGE